jgi:regulator of protease activity HflC (stomatin/prohibitin superfamily)
MARVFKIRHRATGSYSRGGMDPRFDKKGKVWTSRSALSNHLNLVRAKTYDGCDLVEIEVTHTEVSSTDVGAHLQAIIDAKANKEAERRRKRESAQKAAVEAAERAELARLKNKYEQ